MTRVSIKRFVIAAVLSPFLFVGGYLLLAVVGGLIPGSTNRMDDRTFDAPPAFLVFSPIHADFAIPVTPDVRNRFAFLADDGIPLDHPNLKYLVVGWGSSLCGNARVG